MQSFERPRVKKLRTLRLNIETLESQMLLFSQLSSRMQPINERKTTRVIVENFVIKSPKFEKMNQNKLFSWRSAFCLCLVFTLCLRVFIYKEHIKKSNLVVFYLGSTMRTNQVPLNAVSLVVSLRNLTY